ncbi:MAG: polyprenyl diphosphate synthase [Nanoarchaeota archaeon]
MPVNHVAIILDGNRRYAKKHNLPLYRGHEFGAQKVEKLFDWADELGIKELTLYSFSMQNFKRTKGEFNYLMKLFEIFFKKAIDKLKQNPKVQFNFIGRMNLFPKKIQTLAKELERKSKNNKTLKVNFAFGYGGREEIVDAVKQIVKKKIKNINEKIISDNLYLSSEPEIIIRTGGDQRTSNFLPWQSIYSEWFFLSKTWPDFKKLDLKKIVNQFNSRERRFGK